ncbi:hypothetical protein RIF29_21657 [Crotalaria pallida]|uniref:Reverse transcriptase domain-containing protein n=1 Tax=Crotalaria pallida TaxID=3830 RepID=A0AAN9IDM3_CROPI
MNIIAWNIRGIGGAGKSGAVKKLINSNNPSILGLVETKHSSSKPRRWNSWWRADDLGWEEVLAVNGSGGLILMWNQTLFKVLSSTKGDRWINIEGRWTNGDFPVSITLVYAPNDREGRIRIWQQLKILKQSSNSPMMIMEDFNEILCPSERKGCSRLQASAEDFQEWVSDMCLIDLPLLGRKFTWYRNNSASKLDRIFVEAEWVSRFPEMKLWGLNRSISNHCPLLLECSKVNRGPKPFRSLDMWFSNPNFVKMVEKEWKSFAAMPLQRKLNALKASLKKWNKESFGNFDRKIEQLERELNLIDNISDSALLDECTLARRNALTNQLWLWPKRKESYWFQHSRSRTIKEKDRDTRYFHILASVRKSRKTIGMLRVGGNAIREPRMIKQEITKFYKKLYSEEQPPCLKISGEGFARINEEDSKELESLPSLEEIKKSVWDCESSRAPGYNGFNFGFVKRMWDVVGDDFFRFINNFFQQGKLLNEVNRTWVTLIPKIDGACELKHFRPISMVGCIYKVIAKILSNRLKKVLPNLIGETQSTFIGERQILDGALIANEVVNWCKKKKKEAVLLKLDFQKAYDTIS